MTRPQENDRQLPGPPTARSHHAHSPAATQRLRSLNSCPECARQWHAYNGWRSQQRQKGHPMLVAADTSRSVLHDLRRAGLSLAVISDHTGISVRGLRAIEARSVTRVRAATEAQLLAIAEEVVMPRNDPELA